MPTAGTSKAACDLFELTEAVRDAWPGHKPLFFRVSAVDGKGGYWDIDDTVALAKELKLRGVDVIDCSSGTAGAFGSSNMPPVPRGMPGCHVAYSDHVRREADIRTIAVGALTNRRRPRQSCRKVRPTSSASPAK